MREPTLADRCGACGKLCDNDNGWCIDSNGKPRCPTCENAYRRIAGRLANLASAAGNGVAEIEFRRRSIGSNTEPHDCMDYAVSVSTDGPLSHSWECSRCGRHLQAG